MSNTMCGISSAPVSAQIPTTNNAAAEQYVNVIKRVANNDTISIRETVKWLITATESLNLSLMHDTLSRIAVQHEKRVNGILKGLEQSYPDMTRADSQMPIKAVFLQYLMSEKKEALEEIMNALVYSLTISNICDLHHHMLAVKPIEEDDSVTMDTIAKLHNYIGEKAAGELADINPSKPTANSTGQILNVRINNNARFFQEQTKAMDKQRSLTIDELGWNFRRLADYCDELEQALKVARQVPQQQVKACEQTPGCGFNKQGIQPPYHAPDFPPIPSMLYHPVQVPFYTDSASTVKSAASNSHPDYEGFDKAVSKARIPIPWTPFRMATNHMTNALALLSGLITTAIIAQQKDPALLEAERVMVHEAYQAFLESKNVDKSRKLSTKEQIEMIEANLRKMLSYVECCKSLISKDVQDKDCESQN